MNKKEYEIINNYYEGLTEDNKTKFLKKLERLYKQNVRAKTKKYIEDNNIFIKRCIVCNSDGAEIHHLDYSNPYLVLPLCKACHGRQHSKKKLKIAGIDLRCFKNGRMD